MQRAQVEESDAEPGEEDALEHQEELHADSKAAVEFGWEDKRPLTGRRLKAAKDKQKKAKSGSFGQPASLLLGCHVCGEPPLEIDISRPHATPHLS